MVATVINKPKNIEWPNPVEVHFWLMMVFLDCMWLFCMHGGIHDHSHMLEPSEGSNSLLLEGRAWEGMWEVPMRHA